MEDSDSLAIKELIIKALESCADRNLLDLVYKLLLTDAIQ